MNLGEFAKLILLRAHRPRPWKKSTFSNATNSIATIQSNILERNNGEMVDHSGSLRGAFPIGYSLRNGIRQHRSQISGEEDAQPIINIRGTELKTNARLGKGTSTCRNSLRCDWKLGDQIGLLGYTYPLQLPEVRSLFLCVLGC